MTENIEAMQIRHKKELEDLQNNCKHTNISEWMPYMWAPGHYRSDVKLCAHCGKTMETKKSLFTMVPVIMGRNDDDTFVVDMEEG